MNIRSRKVTRDLFGNIARTALVVAAIAVGLVGLSTTIRARAVFSANLDDELAAVNQSSATILVEGAGDAAVDSVAARDDVLAAEGRLTTFGRIAVGEELRPLRLSIRRDLAAGGVDVLRPDEGAWPPPAGSLVLERSSIDAAGLEVGDVATIVDPLGAVHSLPVSATAHDLAVVSGKLVDQVVFGYADVATWERLGLPAGFNEIAIVVAGDRMDEEHVGDVAAAVSEDLAAAGVPVIGLRIPPPGRHVLDNVISSLLLILGALGLLSLVLSGFLVFNTVAAMLARQRPQIGIMKAIGASRREILTMYLAMVGAFSLMSLAVAVPLGAFAARLLTGRLGSLLNIEISDFGTPPWVWLVELATGLVVPLVAAIGPILSGTGATVAEVVRGVEEPTGFGSGRIDRLLAHLQGLPGSWRYAARNTFRRKLRLTLTVVALAIGGAILVTVLTVRSSLLATVDSVEAYWQQDVTVDLQQPAPFAVLQEAVRATPGVAHVEGWLIASGSVVQPDGREAGEQTIVFGVPPAGPFIDATLREGRWLDPADDHTAVVNVDVAANEPGLAVGDEITLNILGATTAWDVVGISTSQLVAPGEPRPSNPIAYVPDGSLGAALGAPGFANRLAVAGTSHDAAAQEALADALEADLRSAGVAVQAVETRSYVRAQVERLTTPILLLLLAMAGLFAVVGGLGLLGTMSLNVLERTGEVGVVRAVGATGRAVLSIVLVEGLTVALLAWVLGSLLAVPLGWVMGNAVGVSFIRVPLDVRFAPLGVAVWLGIAVILAAVASWVPARRASRLSVRDAIAYE